MRFWIKDVCGRQGHRQNGNIGKSPERSRAGKAWAQSRNSFESAYLTVFLSLCLPIILSLFLSLIEGARLNAVRLQAEIAADTAVDSALAEFHKELLKQYDLLMIDTSYGTSNPSVNNVEDHIREYMEENLSTSGVLSFGTRDFTGLSVNEVSISDTRFASDNNCEALLEQIYAYFSAEPVSELAAEVLSLTNWYTGLGLDTTEWNRQKSECESTISEAKEALKKEQEAKSDEEEEEEDPETTAAVAAGEAYVQGQGVSTGEATNIFGVVNDLLSQPVLTQALGGTSGLSQVSVDTSDLYSYRSLHTGDGAEAENSHDYDEAGTIIFDLYAFEKCGNYQDQQDKNVLKYQLEYLLYGKDSDKANLESTAEMILLIRLAANLVAIMTDSEKYAEAQTWGTAIASICLLLPLESVFTMAIILVWTYMESINDVKLLLKGNKVPLIKTASQWNTGLTSIFNKSGSSSSGSDSGLGYEEYLHILLFLENSKTKCARLMDLIEMDIRETEGNENFQMDWCLDTFTVKTEVSSSFGYTVVTEREAGYD